MNYPKCHGEIAVSAGQMAKNIQKKRPDLISCYG
jgi:hypothetical protein